MERQAYQGNEKLVMSSKLNTVGLGAAFEKCRRTQKTGTSRPRRGPGSGQRRGVRWGSPWGNAHSEKRREPRGRVVSTTVFKE